MTPRFFFLGGLAVLAFSTGAVADTNSAVPVTMVDLNGNSSPTTTPPPSTPAPPQPNAKSAPGAAGPNGSNGANELGKAMTKAPNTPPTASSDVTNAPGPAPAPAPAPAVAAKSPAAKASGSLLDNYISDLTDAVKLSADEKKDIQAYYQADGPTLQKLLNDATISPLQQAAQVAGLRDKRDAKIEALLDQDPTREHEFYAVEANYRVALTESAADGGLNPAQPVPAVPQPTKTTPAQATGPTGSL